jgi:anti-sigma factor RsiW
VSLLGGHLGARASALLDGQLSPEESRRAWEHLAGCRSCQEEIERERWIKGRVAGLGYDPSTAAPSALKGELLGAPRSTSECLAAHPRRVLGLAAVSGGALGAAVMGFLAFGAAPADAPTSPAPPRLVSYAPAPPPSVVTVVRLHR